MMSFLADKERNWLLHCAGILILLTACVFIFVVDIDYLVDNGSRSEIMDDISPIGLLIFGVVVAPVFEELAFRGYLTNNKTNLKVSILFLPLYIIAAGYNPVSLILMIVFDGLFVVNLKKDKRLVKDWMIVVNSLLFSLVHYKVSDFSDISLMAPMLFQFTIALVLSWIVINYSLTRSMIVHALWNGILIGGSLLIPEEAYEGATKPANSKSVTIEVTDYQDKSSAIYFIYTAV